MVADFNPSVSQIFRKVFIEKFNSLKVYVVRDDLRQKEITLQLCLLKEIKEELKKTNIYLAEISDIELD